MEFEVFGSGIKLFITKEHTFGTDAFLLSDFAKARRKDKVCDLGTGCGIIPVLMNINYSPQAVYGVEIQKDAVLQFEETVRENRLENIFPVHADIKELWEGYPKHGFDLVTCNPPYKAAGAGIKSAAEAHKIARHETLCDIYDVCRAAERLLRFGGRLCLCSRPERLPDVICAMRENRIEPKLLRFVSKSPSDPPWLFLIEGRYGGKPFMKVLPNLIIPRREG